jgi:hypothetical protein
MSAHGVCANGYGQGYHLPLFFFGSALPQLAEEKRFLQRSRKDTNWKAMNLVGVKNQGFKIISEEW